MNNALTLPIKRDSTEEFFKKAAGTVHIKIHSGSLGLVQRKLINAFHFIAKDDPNRETHFIKRQDLFAMIGYHSNNIVDFKENARKLTSVKVEWNCYEDLGNEKSWGVSSIISEIEYASDGIIAFSFPRKIRELMATQERRGIVSMKIQRQFTMSYALSLYENTTIYRSNGTTPKFKVNDLKALLMVDDNENSTYKLFKHFNNKIIGPSVKEINKVSDILIEPVFFKSGRNVEEISFKVAIKPQSFIDYHEAPSLSSVHDRLISFGCNKNTAVTIMDKYDSEYILGNLDYVESKLISTIGKEIRNPMGYFMDALAKDYRMREPEIVKRAREKREEEAKKKVSAELIREEQIKQHDQKIKQIIDSAKQRYNLLPENEKKIMEEKFLSTIKSTNSIVAKKYIDNGLNSFIVSSTFYSYLVDYWQLK